MKNKRRTNIVLSFEDLQNIKQKAFNSKIQLDEFYARNKMKFPLILESRNELIGKITMVSPIKFKSQLEPIHIEVQSNQENGQQFVQTKPKITKIIFQRDNPNKIKRDYLISKSLTDSKCKTIQVKNKYQKGDGKFKMQNINSINISKFNQNNHISFKLDPLQKLLNELDNTHRKKNISLCQSYSKKNFDLNQKSNSLTINHINTVNPENQLFQTLYRSTRYAANEINELVQKRKDGKYQRIEFPKANLRLDRSPVLKKQSIEDKNFKEIGIFEPWNQKPFQYEYDYS